MSFFPTERTLNELLLICDVDGVVRDSVEAPADPRVIQATKHLLRHPHVEVVFLSGTPVVNDPLLEPWRRGNLSLQTIFADVFEKEIQEGRVSIYGMLGGHRMRPKRLVDTLHAYPLQESFSLGCILLKTFLDAILWQGTSDEKARAEELQKELTLLTLEHPDQPSDATPLEFAPLVAHIRASFDPEFRLINNGAIIEIHTTSPLYQGRKVAETLSSLLPVPLPHIATGLAKRSEKEFQFLLISKTDKGVTSKALVEQKLLLTPQAYIVTIGDTQIDFPMHRHADLAFHVGVEGAWRAHPLSHCALVCDDKGLDKQQVNGTVQILGWLDTAMNKPLSHLHFLVDKSCRFP